MLYSIELWSRLEGRWAAALFFCSVNLLADTCLLTGEVAEVEDTGAANLAELVDLDAVDERGLIGENPFYAHATGNLTHRESLGEGIHTTDLDHNATEFLKPFFISLFNPVGNGDGVTGLELREGSNFTALESLLCNFNQIHIL